MEISSLSVQVGDVLQRRGWRLTVAESCTGGWISQAVTAIAGSSMWFDRGFVTYSNLSKQEMLGVRAMTLDSYGAVSEQVVREMAEGALSRSHAQVAVAVSGIAGPGGGTLEKPVGTVWLAWAAPGMPVRTKSEQFSGDRTAIRRQAVIVALQGILDMSGERG